MDPKCVKVFQKDQTWPRVAQNWPTLPGVDQGVPEQTREDPKRAKVTQISECGPEWPRVGQSVPKWPNVALSSLEWSRVAESGPQLPIVQQRGPYLDMSGFKVLKSGPTWP